MNGSLCKVLTKIAMCVFCPGSYRRQHIESRGPLRVGGGPREGVAEQETGRERERRSDSIIRQAGRERSNNVSMTF